MSKSKTLSLKYEDCNTNDLNEIFELFALKYGPEITEFCSITPQDEIQLDNFGPGSAWLNECEFTLSLSFDPYQINLTIAN